MNAIRMVTKKIVIKMTIRSKRWANKSIIVIVTIIIYVRIDTKAIKVRIIARRATEMVDMKIV